MVQLVALSSIPRVDLNKLMLTTDTNRRTTLPARLFLELLVAAKNPRVVVQLVALSSIPRVDLNKLMLTTDTNRRTTTTTLPARLILSIFEKHTTYVRTE